jgi:MFS family permease
VYVAEHSPDHRRGYYTSFIQTTATLGLFVSLLVILVVRTAVGEAAFRAWGWRIPFLLSVVLVGFSYYIRVRMQESPLFAQLKAVGRTSAAPIRDSFGTAERWKVFFLILFGVTAGQAVVWYTGQFYALFFMQTVLKVPLTTAYMCVAAALALGTPFFLVFGRLSDVVGRKRVMLVGNLLAAICYYPIYRAMTAYSQPPNAVALTLLVFVQVLFVTMSYGPVAAFLVESFPARIRYTSMSLPYHFGNGWFGGFLPLIATAVVARTGNIYAGLIYPIVVALVSVVISALFVRETRHARLWDEVAE